VSEQNQQVKTIDQERPNATQLLSPLTSGQSVSNLTTTPTNSSHQHTPQSSQFLPVEYHDFVDTRMVVHHNCYQADSTCLMEVDDNNATLPDTSYVDDDPETWNWDGIVR
jgi:hypothetical protein